ncbi:hypothetical protein WMY93_031954, partial [Mugilogobius chulae]
MDKNDGNVKYVLTGDGAGTLFLIDEKSGDIHATKRLDREEKAMYILHAKVLDRTTLAELEPDTEFNIKIHDINDNEPRFAKDVYFASVPEMSEVGTSVVTITATDADDQTYGNSAKLVYSILQGQPYFSVDSENGTIKTALPGMDREVKENYQVVIQAKDMAGQMGGLSGTTTVSITLTDVNDSPPRFANHSFRVTAAESTEVGGAIGRIKADDPDIGRNAEMEYTIVGGHDTFNIITDQTTQEGVVIIKKRLDYETKRDYEFRVEVRNTYLDARFIHGLQFKDYATVKVTVEDVDEPPVFTRNPYIIEVHEDTASGSAVGVVSARDPDADNKPVKRLANLQDTNVHLTRQYNKFNQNNSTHIFGLLIDLQKNAVFFSYYVIFFSIFFHVFLSSLLETLRSQNLYCPDQMERDLSFPYRCLNPMLQLSKHFVVVSGSLTMKIYYNSLVYASLVYKEPLLNFSREGVHII